MKKERLMELAGIPEDVRKRYLAEAKYAGQTIPITITWASRYNGVSASVDWDKNPDTNFSENDLERALDEISYTLPDITADWDPRGGPENVDDLLAAAKEILSAHGFNDVTLDFEEDEYSS